ncbi:RAS guanyl-releasing protein 1 [Varanus komodoensis]|nr:RAS guanyl-releasing protein 1 [Varanus komodoensis]
MGSLGHSPWWKAPQGYSIDPKAAVELEQICCSHSDLPETAEFSVTMSLGHLAKGASLDDLIKTCIHSFERVVAGQLQALLDETDYLDPFQSGYRPGYGTESALVALYDDLCREKDRGSVSLLVLLDLSAAFDTIDHGILLDRLAGLGVGGTALQ